VGFLGRISRWIACIKPENSGRPIGKDRCQMLDVGKCQKLVCALLAANAMWYIVLLGLWPARTA
jgi:hypothetical protein